MSDYNEKCTKLYFNWGSKSNPDPATGQITSLLLHLAGFKGKGNKTRRMELLPSESQNALMNTKHVAMTRHNHYLFTSIYMTRWV